MIPPHSRRYWGGNQPPIWRSRVQNITSMIGRPYFDIIMLNKCTNCGTYRPDKQIDPVGPFAICPECGHIHPFLRLPLFMICGAGGAGKTTVYQELIGAHPHVILLEADILWRSEFNKPEENYRDFFETWLRLCKNISQSGRPVVLFCAGGIPANIEPCVERRYFSDVRYLALTSMEDDLSRRLRSRPKWREFGDLEFIQAQVQFNRWFRETGAHGDPAIDLVNTSGYSVADTSRQVSRWINEKTNHLAPGKPPGELD